MASILKVDELQGIVSAGDITVTSEGGAATQSLQQGLAKAWVNIDGTGTTEIRDSLNVSGVVDNGTGQSTITYSNSLSNQKYSVTSACQLVGTSTVEIATSTVSASQTKIVTIQRNTGATSDHEEGFIHAMGDLA